MLWSIFPVMLSNFHMPRLAQIYSISIEKYQSELRKYGTIYFLVGLFLTIISILAFNIQYHILNYQNNSLYLAGIILCFINIPISISLLQSKIIAINNLQVYALLKVTIYFISMTFLSLMFVEVLDYTSPNIN